MGYKFDNWGWYAGETEDTHRTTDIAPEIVPETKVEGEPYPNWTSSGWLMLDYVEPPVFVPPELPEPVEDPQLWWIDVGPFKDRLGMDALAIAASDHSICRGVASMVDGRKYIDLKDGRVLAMLNALIATSQPAADPYWPGSGPMTVGKRDTILNTPTVEDERHIKGLS